MKKLTIVITLLILILGIGPFVVYVYFNDEETDLTDEVRSELSGHFIRLSKGYVHYEMAGPEDGKKVVLVHGFSTPYYIWDPTFEALVEKGFRVLRYDLYGRGFSDRPKADYDLALFKEQLLELIVTLKLKGPVSLVGMSMGGAVVATMANQHPEKVDKIVLIDPQAFPPPLETVSPLMKPFIGEYLTAVVWMPRLQKQKAEDYYRPERFPDAGEKIKVQMKYRGYRRALLSTLREMVKKGDMISLYESLADLNLPVQVIWGKEDRKLLPGSLEKIREALPNAALHIIDEAGHEPHYERPEIVNPLLIEFLADPLAEEP